MALKYRGTNPSTDWIAGVPARDLSDAEIKALGLNEAELAKSRLYSSSKTKPESATKEGAE